MSDNKFRNKSHCWRMDYVEEDDIPELSTLSLRRDRYWKDACDHPEETYVGSASFIDYANKSGKFCSHTGKPIREAKERCIDVYVFHDEFMNSQDVCIRCGDDGPDYISPGTVLDMLITSQRLIQNQDGKYEYCNTAYAAAACVINHYMEIRATLRP